jgi:hypothetical protein
MPEQDMKPDHIPGQLEESEEGKPAAATDFVGIQSSGELLEEKVDIVLLSEVVDSRTAQATNLAGLQPSVDEHQEIVTAALSTISELLDRIENNLTRMGSVLDGINRKLGA